LNLPNGTYPVASIRDGLLTIVYPLSSFTVDRIAVAGLDDDNDGTVDEPGEEYRFFDAYNGSGGVLAGVTSVTARPDAAGWRVDILIGANDYLHAGQHPTPPGSQFQVHITTSPGAGTLTVLNAVNVDVAGSLALQITGTECGELIAVGDDKVDGANSDAKAIYFGTVEGVYNGGANLTSVGIEYDKAIMDAMFGSPSISRAEIAALDGDDIVRVKEEINQQQMLNAGAGNDTVHSGSGKSQVFGGGGIDLLVGGAADDVIYGDAGDDRIFAGAGDDRVFGGLGDDYIAGYLGNDSLLKGEDGNDRISGGDGRDRLYGDAGSDIGYRDSADLLVYQVESVYNTPPDPVEQALRELVDTYWNDKELADGDEDGAWDTLDELIAQILP
jgi:Ca2+-binding RTX toxin-like protein